MRLTLLVMFGVFLAVCPRMVRADGTLEERPLGSTAAPFGFMEYLPNGYDACTTDRHPLVIALSGLGELGNGTTMLRRVLSGGVGPRIVAGDPVFDAEGIVVLIPQAPDQWMISPQKENIAGFIDFALSTYRIDAGRVYLTGLSSGGGGVYRFVADGTAGDRLAAVIPICGNSDAYAPASRWTTIPMWSFQSWGDGTNPRSRPIGWTNLAADARAGVDVADVMNTYPNAGGDPAASASTTMTATLDTATWAWTSGIDSSGPATLRLTLFPGNDHDAWTRAYSDPGVWSWLLAQRRAGADPGVRCGGADAGMAEDASAAIDGEVPLDAASSAQDGDVIQDDAARPLVDANVSDAQPSMVDAERNDASSPRAPLTSSCTCGVASRSPDAGAWMFVLACLGGVVRRRHARSTRPAAPLTALRGSPCSPFRPACRTSRSRAARARVLREGASEGEGSR